MAAGCILVVDPHPEVLGITKAMLSRASFSVWTANNGVDALEFLKGHSGTDLVLAEALMPGLSGTELIAKVQEAFPHTAVMLMTGYTEQPLDSGIPLIEKPFTMAALIEKVKRVLARSVKARCSGA